MEKRNGRPLFSSVSGLFCPAWTSDSGPWRARESSLVTGQSPDQKGEGPGSGSHSRPVTFPTRTSQAFPPWEGAACGHSAWPGQQGCRRLCPSELKRVWGSSELGLGSFQAPEGAGDEGVLRLDYNRRSKLSRNFRKHLSTWKSFGII